MTEPLITATVLNPGDYDGPRDVELVLTGPEGEEAGRETVTTAGSDDWDATAGPTVLRLRGLAEARGWVDPRGVGGLHPLQPDPPGTTLPPGMGPSPA